MANKLPDSGPISMLDIYNVLNPQIDPKDCDYYFETIEDFETRLDSILELNKNTNGKIDLSQKTFGFGDNINHVNFSISVHYEYESIPKQLIGYNITSIKGIFSDCDVENIPNEIFKFLPNLENADSCFSACNYLTNIPEDLFKNNPNLLNISGSFYGNNDLKTVPLNLFNNNLKLENVSYCFSDCFNLESELPEVWNRDKYKNVIETMGFAENTKASNINKIPEDFGGTYVVEDIPPSFSNIVDYYFPTLTNFDSRISNIITENNGDLSQKTFGFSDNILSIRGIFSTKNKMKKSPKSLYGNNIYTIQGCFSYCALLTDVSDLLFNNCNKKIKNVSECFDTCINITSTLPDVWNKEKFPNIINGSGYAEGCTKAANYNEIPSNFGGPSTNPPVPLAENTTNNTKSLVNSIIRTANIPTSPISLNDKDFRELAGKQIIPIFKFTNETSFSEPITILSKNKNEDFSDMKIGDPYYIKIGGSHSGGSGEYYFYNNNKSIGYISGGGMELKFTMENLTNDIFLCEYGKTPSFSNNLQPTIPAISLKDFYGKSLPEVYKFEIQLQGQYLQENVYFPGFSDSGLKKSLILGYLNNENIISSAYIVAESEVSGFMVKFPLPNINIILNKKIKLSTYKIIVKENNLTLFYNYIDMGDNSSISGNIVGNIEKINNELQNKTYIFIIGEGVKPEELKNKKLQIEIFIYS